MSKAKFSFILILLLLCSSLYYSFGSKQVRMPANVQGRFCEECRENPDLARSIDRILEMSRELSLVSLDDSKVDKACLRRHYNDKLSDAIQFISQEIDEQRKRLAKLSKKTEPWIKEEMLSEIDDLKEQRSILKDIFQELELNPSSFLGGVRTEFVRNDIFSKLRQMPDSSYRERLRFSITEKPRRNEVDPGIIDRHLRPLGSFSLSESKPEPVSAGMKNLILFLRYNVASEDFSEEVDGVLNIGSIQTSKSNILLNQPKLLQFLTQNYDEVQSYLSSDPKMKARLKAHINEAEDFYVRYQGKKDLSLALRVNNSDPQMARESSKSKINARAEEREVYFPELAIKQWRQMRKLNLEKKNIEQERRRNSKNPSMWADFMSSTAGFVFDRFFSEIEDELLKTLAPNCVTDEIKKLELDEIDEQSALTLYQMIKDYSEIYPESVEKKDLLELEALVLKLQAEKRKDYPEEYVEDFLIAETPKKIRENFSSQSESMFHANGIDLRALSKKQALSQEKAFTCVANAIANQLQEKSSEDKDPDFYIDIPRLYSDLSSLGFDNEILKPKGRLALQSRLDAPNSGELKSRLKTSGAPLNEDVLYSYFARDQLPILEQEPIGGSQLDFSRGNSNKSIRIDYSQLKWKPLTQTPDELMANLKQGKTTIVSIPTDSSISFGTTRSFDLKRAKMAHAFQVIGVEKAKYNSLSLEKESMVILRDSKCEEENVFENGRLSCPTKYHSLSELMAMQPDMLYIDGYSLVDSKR